MELYETKTSNETNTSIPHIGPNLNDLQIRRLIKSEADLAVVAYLKTLGEQEKFTSYMTAKEISDLGGGTPTGRRISDILRKLGVRKQTKKSNIGFKFDMHEFRSYVTLTSLPSYTLDDLKTAKPPVTVDLNTGFAPTYISLLKRWRPPASLDDPIVDHPYYRAAVRLFRERYDTDFYDHLKLYHEVLDKSVLAPAPPHMLGYCLKYEAGSVDDYGYRSISSYKYKNKYNPTGPDLHTKQAHRLVSMVHHFEYDFGGRGEHRYYDVHHMCEVPNCVNPNHLMPVAKLAHQEFHKETLVDDHPFDTDPRNEFNTAIHLTNGHADVTAHVSIH